MKMIQTYHPVQSKTTLQLTIIHLEVANIYLLLIKCICKILSQVYYNLIKMIVILLKLKI